MLVVRWSGIHTGIIYGGWEIVPRLIIIGGMGYAPTKITKFGLPEVDSG